MAATARRDQKVFYPLPLETLKLRLLSEGEGVSTSAFVISLINSRWAEVWGNRRPEEIRDQQERIRNNSPGTRRVDGRRSAQ